MRHGEDQGKSRWCGIGSSVRPGTAVRGPVLVADMGDGSLSLHWQDGPSAYLSRAGAASLRWELAAAFDSTELALRGNLGEVR